MSSIQERFENEFEKWKHFVSKLARINRTPRHGGWFRSLKNFNGDEISDFDLNIINFFQCCGIPEASNYIDPA
jgi:hypothetical protein